MDAKLKLEVSNLFLIPHLFTLVDQLLAPWRVPGLLLAWEARTLDFTLIFKLLSGPLASPETVLQVDVIIFSLCIALLTPY